MRFAGSCTGLLAKYADFEKARSYRKVYNIWMRLYILFLFASPHTIFYF
jgi:hypothetical protein